MAKYNFTKRGEYLVACDDQCREYLSKKKDGALIQGAFTSPRNPDFHRKFFSLLNYSFDCWQPSEIDCKYGTPEKNFETFRDFVIIRAGYHTIAFTPDGSFKPVADSISFANMEQDDFEKLYSNVINTILKYILTNYTKTDLDDVVMNVIRYG